MDGDFELLVTRLAERQQNSVFGKYRGTVEDNADPDDLGRVRARVPSLTGDLVLPWAMPCLPFAGKKHGLALIPEKGDGVWIEFEAGAISAPIWSGTWWAKDQRPEPKGVAQRLLATSKGHKFLIDEDEDEIRLTHPGGAELVMTDDAITLTIGQTKIEMTSSEIILNDGIAKLTLSGASLVNDAFKVGG